MWKVKCGMTAIGQQLWPRDRSRSAVYHPPHVGTAVVKCVMMMRNACLCAMVIDLTITYSLYINLDCC